MMLQKDVRNKLEGQNHRYGASDVNGRKAWSNLGYAKEDRQPIAYILRHEWLFKIIIERKVNKNNIPGGSM